MSSKQKKVHYERGSKSSSHRQQPSRDSAIGSTSASDRASLGTTVPEASFPPSQVENQRYNLRVVQEALDAAHDRIKHLEASNASLSESLAESNKENRTLKKEKSGLIKENEDLLCAIDDLNKRLKREGSPRSMATATGSVASRERPPSFRKSESPRPLPLEETLNHPPRQTPHYDERRSSTLYQRTTLPIVPVPPPNPHPNPFTPRTTPVVTYAPSMSTPVVTYAPSTISYTTAPIYAVSTTSSKRKSHDDGKYHLQPL